MIMRDWLGFQTRQCGGNPKLWVSYLPHVNLKVEEEKKAAFDLNGVAPLKSWIVMLKM